jgi:hypothetical protein
MSNMDLLMNLYDLPPYSEGTENDLPLKSISKFILLYLIAYTFLLTFFGGALKYMWIPLLSVVSTKKSSIFIDFSSKMAKKSLKDPGVPSMSRHIRPDSLKETPKKLYPVGIFSGNSINSGENSIESL